MIQNKQNATQQSSPVVFPILDSAEWQKNVGEKKSARQMMGS
jgi:hypothetical protein